MKGDLIWASNPYGRELVWSREELTDEDLEEHIQAKKQTLSTVDFFILEENLLKTLTPVICDLVNLKHLGLSGNQLMHLPGAIGRLVNLESLDVRDNALETLPPEIGRLSSLVVLNLWRNKLSRLPSTLAWLCNGLQRLHLDGNELLPAWLCRDFYCWIDVHQATLDIGLFYETGPCCAVQTAICMFCFRNQDCLLLGLPRDVFRKIVQMVWESRHDGLWNRTNQALWKKKQSKPVPEIKKLERDQSSSSENDLDVFALF